MKNKTSQPPVDSMKIDFQGRIRNTKLPYRQCLLPLMEAVVNSIQAILVRNSKEAGKIEIQVERSLQQFLDIEDSEKKKKPISGFEICDNGIGFTEENFDSFLTADTTHKLVDGGRGIGRFSWLKAFSEAKIESFFSENNSIKLRKFRFCLSPKGIEDHSCEIITSPIALKTVISLIGFLPKYQENCPKSSDTLALRIVEHCLEFFVFDSAPEITILDEDRDTPIDLKGVFRENFSFSSKPKQFSVKGELFYLRDVQIFKAYETDHKINLCANKRVVLSTSISSRIPHTGSSLFEKEKGEFVYVAYITGDYLDSIVNSERTGFDFFEMDLELPSKEEILSFACKLIEDFIKPFTQENRIQSFNRAKAYIANSAPVYRYLLDKRKIEIEELPAGISEAKLDIELHKFHIEEKTSIKQESTDLLDPKNFSDDNFLEENKEKIEELFKKLNDVVKSELAEYVLQRKVVLEYLRNLQDQKTDGSYQLEKAVHQIIFPLRTSSEYIDYQAHNLWVIDERLVYHEYLASDSSFSSQEGSPIQVESNDRPDILIYNKAFALTEGNFPIGSCVIIEFKRPERNEYTDSENPIQQVLRYIDRIREGKAKDRGGSTIEIPEKIPFYCYVIASLTPKLREFSRMSGLTSTPDGGGFFGYIPDYRAYVEVLSFKKIFEDAKRRNQAFFDKLNL